MGVLTRPRRGRLLGPSSFDGHVGAGEGGDVVLIGVGGGGVVLAAVEEVKANGLPKSEVFASDR